MRFGVGDYIFQPSTGKYFTVEQLKTHMGLRFLLRSLEAGNPGTPKTAEFLDLQIQDGHLVRMTPREFRRATR